MTEILGLNWQLLLGVIMLLISIILIVYGLSNNINSKTLFNVSRLLALISVAGIWYFGNINTKNTSLEIEKNKKETAEAITKTAELELNVTSAKKETEEAKLETEKIKLKVESASEAAQKAKLRTEEMTLEVEKAIAEAENAKLEREKIRQQTLILEKQNTELKIESDRIKSFTIRLIFKIREEGKSSLSKGFTQVYGIEGRAALLDGNREILYFFNPGNNHNTDTAKDGRGLLIFNLHPENPELLFTKSIRSLESVNSFEFALGNLVKYFKIKAVNLIDAEIQFIINEIQLFTLNIRESKMGEIENSKSLQVSVKNQFSNIIGLYKSKTKKN
ncbi:hypothetical protein [Aquimarina macrocephali]|uniref:hypothetical protein n=1 Tax=Aquimarina macrocephali TaxID=666563 RepID=UPI003F679BD5